MSSLKFDVTGNANGFVSATREAEAAANQMTRNITKEGNSLDDMFKKLAVSAAAFFTLQQGNQLVSEIINVRGEFQKLEIAFETMLGSKAKSDALMSELTQTAAKTPFSLQDVSNGAKQLLAYGIASEEVNETLVRLGDIASGLSIPLNDLVYLYGTTAVQGRMFTNDMRQFMGRGIPLADELAKMFDKDTSEINDMVTEGKIGFDEMKEALWSMTNAGGKFYNLMEKQSASLSGQISNLGDAFDMMKNKIGESMQGILSSGISSITYLVENYEKIGKIIVTLVSAYGAYRTAILLCAAAHKIEALSRLAAIKNTTLLSVVTDVLKGKLVSLAAVMKSVNPYALIAAAATAAIVAVEMFNETETEKAIEERNEALKRQNAELEELKNRERAVVAAQKEAAKESAGEISSIETLLSAIRDETNSLEDRRDAIKELQGILPGYEAHLDEEGRLYNENTQAVEDHIISLQRLAYAKALQAKREEIVTQRVQAQIERRELVRQQDEKEDEVAKAQAEYDRQLAISNEAYEMASESTGGKWLAGFEETAVVRGGAYDDNKTERDNAYDELGARKAELDVIKGEIKVTDAKIDAALQDLADLDEIMNEYDEELKIIQEDDDSPIGEPEIDNKVTLANQKVAELKKKNAKENEQALLDIRAKAREAEIKAMEDGFEKITALRDFEKKSELDEIEEQKNNYIDAVVQREKEIFDAEEKAKLTANEKYKIQTFDEESARQRAKSSEGALLYDQIYFDTQARQASDALKAEADAMNEFLLEYGNYQEKKEAIATKYAKLIAEAETEGERKSLAKQKEEELYALEQQYKKTASAIQNLFGDMSKKSAQDLNAIADEGEKALEFIKGGEYKADNPFGISQEAFNQIKDSPEELENIAEAIEDIRTQADKLEGPIKRIGEGFRELFEAEKGTEAFDKAFSKIQSGVSDITDAISFVSDSLASMGEALGSEVLTKTAEAIDSTLNVVDSTMSGAQAGAAFGPWGAAIGAAVGLATSLVTEISKAKDAVHQAEIDRLAEEVENIDKDYEALGRSIDKAYSVDASDLIKQQNTLLEQKKANLELMIAEEEAKKNADSDQVKQWKAQIDEIDNSIADNADKAQQAITGITFDDFRNKFLDALLDMERGVEGLSESIEEDIRKAMYESLLTGDAFENELEGLYEDLATAIETDDAAAIKRIKEQIYALYNEQERQAREIDEKIGYEAASERSASQKGVAQASQSSVDELNGRATAIQSHTFSINQQMASVVAIGAQILGRVSSIDGHTSRLEAIENSLTLMKSDISDIATRGIRVKTS